MISQPAAQREGSAYVVYHGGGASPDAYSELRLRWLPADTLLTRRLSRVGPAVVMVDRSVLDHVSDPSNIPRHVVIVAVDEESEQALGKRADLSVVGLATREAKHRVLRAACSLSDARLTATRRRRELARTHCDLRQLKRIGMSLMHERDQETLLRQIVQQGKLLTESDAGGLLLVDKDPRSAPQLRLALCEVDSLPDLTAFTDVAVPIDDTSIVGHAALTKQPVVIADAYDLPADALFVRNPSFDQRFGYRIRSMLIVPMVDHRDTVLGVLVFVNRKSERTARIRSKPAADRYVLPYTRREVRAARALASQAAVSIENARLYAQVERILDSFVKAAVSAIDRRDPSTAGHSVRVARLTTDLAAAVEREGQGVYRDTHFTRAQIRELHFAALLHDLGKVGVPEDVLTKSKKLPPYLWERVSARFDLIRRTLELESYKRRAVVPRQDVLDDLDAELRAQRERLEQMWSVIRMANEPTAEPAIDVAKLHAIAARTFEAPGGITPYLTRDELHYLEIPHGTLDEHERAEIESHVGQTYLFLVQIPWTNDLKNMAKYAYGHHERLDGTGYPRGLTGDAIPIQTRLLTIADIFDALTESDRPYRRALPPDKALAILEADARTGLLDPELVRIMVESQVYKSIIEGDWRQL